MEFGESERRRLNAEAFDILEQNDGFRLQLLVEFRNRASNSRRLLIDELVRANLISRLRRNQLFDKLGIDPGSVESLASEQTLGEDSYEDSIVDVAPMPRPITSPISASITERRTLGQGSRIGTYGFETSESATRREEGVDDDLSMSLDASYEVLHVSSPHVSHGNALIGSPARHQLTDPDLREITQSTRMPPTLEPNAFIEALFHQLNTLIHIRTNTELRPLCTAMAAMRFGELTSQLSDADRGPEVSTRLVDLHCLLLAEISEDEAASWFASQLTAQLKQLNPSDEKLARADHGKLSIRTSQRTQVAGLNLRNGWLEADQNPLELNVAEDFNENAELNVHHCELPEGWYEIRCGLDSEPQITQAFVSRAKPVQLHFPDNLKSTDNLRYIGHGFSILGHQNDPQKALPADLYKLNGFRISSKPVSLRNYFTFLRFLAQTQGQGAALRRSPRGAPRGEYQYPDLNFSDEEAVEAGIGMKSDHPVTGISFHDARAYCHWLNIERGPGHRLPTELEWEKSIRGSVGTKWSWGDLWDDEAMEQPSRYGVSLMSEVKLEWTSTIAPDNRYRISKGLGLDDDQSPFGLSARHFVPEEQVNRHLGFRIAKAEI